MRVVCTSDTHDRHARVVVPDGDVLVHAGDLTMMGEPATIDAGIAWLAAQPHERILFVPGNHDWEFERDPLLVGDLAEKYPRVEILIDRVTTIGDLVVYGSPWQPRYHDWAFNFADGIEGEAQAERTWAAIPDDVALLITHGPPYGILDLARRGERAGCPALARRIAKLASLRLAVFGHIHEGYGREERDGVTFVNAAACDLRYRISQAPIVVDLA